MSDVLAKTWELIVNGWPYVVFFLAINAALYVGMIAAFVWGRSK